MKITDIKIRSINNDGKMRAVVSVTFDDALALHDIKIVEANDKRFLAMPAKKLPDGKFKDIAHPINEEFRTMLENAVLERYNEQLAETPDTITNDNTMTL